MNEAVIVSTARTPIGKAYKGAFNNTHGATLAGHAVKKAVEVSGIDPLTVEDCFIGCAMPEGATGGNIARQIAIREASQLLQLELLLIDFVHQECKQ